MNIILYEGQNCKYIYIFQQKKIPSHAKPNQVNSLESLGEGTFLKVEQNLF